MASKYGHYEDYGWRVRKDGSKFWANVIITSLKDENGNGVIVESGVWKNKLGGVSC
jgi:hypothetical protein